MKVLTVDYQAGNAQELFSKSMKETGFAVLRNHPISVDLINEAYDKWRDFFNSANKMNYVPEKNKQNGYFPFRSEHAKDSMIADLKEFYHYYPASQNPESTRDVSGKMFKQLSTMASTLLQWIENHLPKEVSDKLFIPLKDMIVDSPNTLLRILHYPPLGSDIEEGAIRGAAHEDINLITLLPAATAPGLEVKDVHGNWHAVPCDPGSVVVNVGDMLQACTDYYLKSTTHRVINPSDEHQHQSRYSMPLFLHARPEVRITEELTAQQYLDQRLHEIGLY